MERYQRSGSWGGKRIGARIIPSLAAGFALAFVVPACGGGGGSASNTAQAASHSPPVAVTSSIPPSPSPDLAPSSPSGSGFTPTSPAPDESSSGPTSSQGPSSEYLDTLTPVTGTIPNTGSIEVNGQYYANSIYLAVYSGQPFDVSYNLGRQWGHLQATIGLTDDSAENEQVQFQVFADQRLIYSKVFELGQSQQINLNVSHVLRLELVATLESAFVGFTQAAWGNASLTS